jgi:membrane-bound lytic murein transglycosylase B
MQFMPRTFARYAVDGDGDGVASPWSPADAVFTAARYLCVNGGGSPATVRQALFAYNRAQWYVDLVLAVQAQIAAVES